MKQKILKMCNTLNSLLKAGKTLKEIRNITFEMREAGEDMIYFSFGTNGKDEYLVPAPTSKQKAYKDFFSEIAENAISFPKYSLFIYSDRIEFTENIKLNKQIIKTQIINFLD